MTYRILCYGDSNTYGYIPGGYGRRYDEKTRWTKRLQSLLGTGYEIIEEGCSGRTTDIDVPGEEWKSGERGLYISLHSHKPVDMIILMLGTNDLKTSFHRNAETIAACSARLAEKAEAYLKEKQGYAPVILFLCPPHLGENAAVNPFGWDFGAGSYEVSRMLSPEYRKQSEMHHYVYLDTSLFLKSSETDGVHLDPSGHEKLAQELYRLITDSVK